MYIKTTNGAYEKPYSIGQLRKDNPQTSFPKNPPAELLAQWGVFAVTPVNQPAFDPASHKAVEGDPTEKNGQWVQVWQVVPLTADEIAGRLAVLQADVISQTQNRLDSFAQTRGYDGILSACTYATSTVEKFATEGQYCVGARDATWAKLYELLAEIEAGDRPVPSGYADIENELPALTWPDQP
jgi:hypothetical protein